MTLLWGFKTITWANDKIYDKTVSAYFAWGCFWCLEWIFESQDWIQEVIVGYIWGTPETANYQDVAWGVSQHREAVEIVYAPDVISYEKIIELFWTQIDPTDPGGQFADRGFQYTTAIYYSNQNEKNIAQLSKDNLQRSWKFEKDIVTPLVPTTTFFRWEEYHQDYYKKAALRYKLYAKWSGRTDFIDQNWKDRIAEINTTIYAKESLKEKLTPIQYYVTQENGTEPPFKNKYWDNKREGIYVDIIDGTPLYSSKDKFDSGTGWPSFSKGISEDHFTTHSDTTLFITRTELRSASSDAHLGHIFPDAPKELWGIRHCINSAALRFIPVEDLQKEWYEDYLDAF